MRPQSRLAPRILISIAVIATLLMIVVPLVYIFAAAFAQGWRVYAQNIMDPLTLHAIWLTVLVALIVVPVNIAFGVAAPTPIRAPRGEDALRGRPTTQDAVNEAAAAALQDTRARDSWRASKAFREHLLEEIARRCLLKSIKRAGGEVVGVHS